MKRFKTFLVHSIIMITTSAGMFFLPQVPAYALTVNVSQGIPLTSENVRKALVDKDSRFSSLEAEILVFGYSTGKEIYNLAGNGELQMKTEPGEIQGLVKFKNATKLKKAIFIRGKGSDPDSLARSLADDALRVLGPYLN
jgi:hypothetical protein